MMAQRNKSSWTIYETTSLVEAVHTARDNGWYEKIVQVRSEIYGCYGELIYYIEPFEKECSCPNILRYSDFFDPPETG